MIRGADLDEAIKGTRDDPHFSEARELVLKTGRASISIVQRHLRIGYNHAARLVEAIEGDILSSLKPDGTRSIGDEHAFPPLPKYKGFWFPIYWTPIPGSGERLTAMIFARGEDGQVCMRRTIRDDVLDAAFGIEKARSLRQLFDYVENTLPAWMGAKERNPAMADSDTPATGFYLGPARDGAADNIRQLAAQGVCLNAAFADPRFADLNQK